MNKTKDRSINEFLYNATIHNETKALTEKFKTREFILFGFIPEKGWVKVFYQSIGLLDEYKLVRKKTFPVVWICGNCIYFNRGACIHKNSRDKCADSDTNRKCYNNSFVSMPWDWDSYTNEEKEIFRHLKILRN